MVLLKFKKNTKQITPLDLNCAIEHVVIFVCVCVCLCVCMCVCVYKCSCKQCYVTVMLRT